MEIYYYVAFINESYVWLFDNRESTYTFVSEFNFDLTNLEIENTEPGTNKWELHVKPQEKVIKCLKRIDAMQKSKYKISFTFSILTV
jgi:hypothetical protein